MSTLTSYIFTLFLSFSISSACPSVCQCAGRTVWCDGQQLTGIPTGIPVNAKQIYLYDNNITSIPPGVFSNLKDLQRLDLTNNQITNSGLSPNIFSELVNLKELTLSENSLTRITKKMFSGVESLERLYVENNKIRTIERGALSNMSHLVELKLGWNRINIFPKITECPNLRRLCLEHNQISRLQGTFSEMKLEQLTLSGNQLKELAPSVFNVDNSNLRELDVSENLLQLVPRIISNMTSLHTLNLSQNIISTLPSTFLDNLKQIKVLDLSGMKLTSLPEGFIPRGTFLNVADLSNNPWNCNCDIAWIPTLMTVFEGAFINEMDVQCSTPFKYRGKSLSSVYGGLLKCNGEMNTNINNVIPSSNPSPSKRPLIELCEIMVCENGGVCYINEKEYPACRCPPGWKGFVCTEKDHLPSLIPSEIPTSTKKSVVPVDPYKPKLIIQTDTLTPYSVEIILPATGKKMTISVAEILPGSSGGPILRREFNVTPTRHNYVVTNLESGTRYNICISTVEVIPGKTNRVVHDELCGDVTTKVTTTIAVNDRGTLSSVTKTEIDDTVGKLPEAKEPDDQGVIGGDNSAITNPTKDDPDFQLLYPALGASLGAFLIITIVVLFVCYRSKKNVKNPDTASVNSHKQYKKGQKDDCVEQEAIPMVNTQQRMYLAQQQQSPQMHALLPQNDESYHVNNYVTAPMRVSTPSKAGSLGRSSTSGGSVSGTPHAYPVDMQRCCSIPTPPMHSTMQVDGMRYVVTPQTGANGGYQGNGTMYNNRNPYTTSQHIQRPNRGPDYMYRHPSTTRLPHEVGVDTCYVDTGVRGMVIPVQSNCTTVNQYHQAPIASTSVHPETTFQPLSSPIHNYRDMSPLTHQGLPLNSRNDQIGLTPLYSDTLGTYMSSEYCAPTMSPSMTSSFHDTLVM